MDHNITNGTAETQAAMWLFGARYSKFGGGQVDFYNSLSKSDKRLCKELVDSILEHADRRS